jgi:hypothetical protein
MRLSELKECYLVAAKNSVRGGIRYTHANERTETEGSKETAQWETTRRLDDKAEYAKAQSIRNRYNRAVRGLGVDSPIGIIVPMDREDLIEDFDRQWSETVADFNATARFSQVSMDLEKFEIKGENMRAMENMVNSMQNTLGDLRAALESADYDEIREVVKRMRGYISVLPDNQAASIQTAIDDARVQAREIRKALVRKGEEIEDVKRTVSVATVDLARFALLGEENSDDAPQDAPTASDVMAAAAGVQAVAAYGAVDSDGPQDASPQDEPDDPEPYGPPKPVATVPGRILDMDDF